MNSPVSPEGSVSTPQPYSHVRQESLDRQIRAGGMDASDDVDDIDGKLQKVGQAPSYHTLHSPVQTRCLICTNQFTTVLVACPGPCYSFHEKETRGS